MSNTPSETITPENDDDQKATVENPRKTGIIPDSASFQQLQALEDAIDFRTARVDCPARTAHQTPKMADVTNTRSTST